MCLRKCFHTLPQKILSIQFFAVSYDAVVLWTLKRSDSCSKFIISTSNNTKYDYLPLKPQGSSLLLVALFQYALTPTRYEDPIMGHKSSYTPSLKFLKLRNTCTLRVMHVLPQTSFASWLPICSQAVHKFHQAPGIQVTAGIHDLTDASNALAPDS